jgi:hypothetical protein
MEFHLEPQDLMKNWAKGSCLHLDDTSTHEKEVEVSICEFHDLLKNLI